MALSVPASAVPFPSAPDLIVRLEAPGDEASLAGVDLEHLAWVETGCALAERPELQGRQLDVLLTDPAGEAPLLYRLARLHSGGRLRVTIPCVPGVAMAGAVAIGLGLPVRLLAVQPCAQAVEEMEQVLERYLHDAQARAPVEFFHSALGRLIHGHPASLWEVLEQDPDLFPWVPGRTPEERPQGEGFVARHLAALDDAGAECRTCPFHDWCAGWFKWPEPSYDCSDVRRLLGRIEDAAVQIKLDLAQVESLEP